MIIGGDIFCERENTGSITLGDNPAGHCFILMDLIPMDFSINS